MFLFESMGSRKIAPASLLIRWHLVVTWQKINRLRSISVAHTFPTLLGVRDISSRAGKITNILAQSDRKRIESKEEEKVPRAIEMAALTKCDRAKARKLFFAFWMGY